VRPQALEPPGLGETAPHVGAVNDATTNSQIEMPGAARGCRSDTGLVCEQHPQIVVVHDPSDCCGNGVNAVSDSSGFTLIAILVVIVVIAILTTLVAPNVFHHVAAAKDATTTSQIETPGTGFVHTAVTSGLLLT